MKTAFVVGVPALLALVPSMLVAADVAPLQSVDVVGRRSSGAYHAVDASGTKTELPLKELPQAIRVMSRQSLDDLGAVRVDDALDFVGGVSRQSNFGGMWDNVAIRGLAGDINSGMALLQNGFSANRGINAPRDTANIERIEFLKGAAASLYGASEPGGTLNVVTKRPLWRRSLALEAYVGSYDSYRTTLDAAGPFNAASAYRLNAAIEKRGSFRDHIQSQRQLLAPAVTWRLAAGTSIDYRGELLRQAAPLDRGVVAIGNAPGAIPRERFLGEPGDGDIKIDNLSHQVVLEQRLGEQWSVRAALSRKDGSMRGYSTEPQPALQPDGRTLRRQRRYRDYTSDDTALQLEAVGRVMTGAVLHQLLVGVDAYRFDYDQRMLRANPSATSPYAIDVLLPVYGQPQPAPQPNTSTFEEQRNQSLYLQDALSIGAAWRVVAGARIDRYQQSLLNRRTGLTTSQSPTATSPRLGLSYLAGPDWNLFVNTGRSFRPNTGSSASGAAFLPERGVAVEAGVKWESGDQRQGATIALFDIRKRDVLTADVANPGFSVTAGAVRSRGMDADYSGQLSAAWRANASLSLIDAAVTRDLTVEQGGRLLNIPRVNGSLLLVYENAASALGRFSLGGGVTYTGRRLGEARTQAQADGGAPAFELPAYTVAKLVGHWHLRRNLSLSLDIDNLFDRAYYTSSYQRTWVTPGPARSATLGLQAKF
jgi:iron complex outermembrane receptor protein